MTVYMSRTAVSRGFSGQNGAIHKDTHTHQFAETINAPQRISGSSGKAHDQSGKNTGWLPANTLPEKQFQADLLPAVELCERSGFAQGEDLS